MSVRGTNAFNAIVYGCSSYCTSCSAEWGRSYYSTPDAPLSHTPGCIRPPDFHLDLISVDCCRPEGNHRFCQGAGAPAAASHLEAER